MRCGRSGGLADSMHHAGTCGATAPPGGTISPFRTPAALNNVQQGGTETGFGNLPEFFSPPGNREPPREWSTGEMSLFPVYVSSRRLQRSAEGLGVCRHRDLVSKYELGKVNFVSKSGRQGRMSRTICARNLEVTACQRTEYPCFLQVAIKMPCELEESAPNASFQQRVSFFVRRAVLS
jgi:hypothetical protein